MHTDQIYIARDGKSGMHVLVRILAVDDIGADYPPIDPDNFNKLMMARDVKSLVQAARDLGPMYISADILSRRTFIPSHLQHNLVLIAKTEPSVTRTAPFLAVTLQTSIIRRPLKMRVICCFYIYLIK